MVELCRTSGKSIPDVARDLGLGVTAVRRWVAQSDIDTGRRPGMTSEEHSELVQLRKENRMLYEERDILKREQLSSPRDPMKACPFI